MTTKEITELRKSGHLQEALAAAENEFAQNVNVYTVGALFWCLNDLSKLQKGEDAIATVERMKSLYNDYCVGDELMQKALSLANNRSLLHYQEVKMAVENAKNGVDVLSSHQQVTKWHDEGTLDEQLYQDLGWLTYYALKQTPLGAARERKVLLNQYLQLNLPRPHLLHSLILREAVKVEKNTPLQFRIRDFIRIWDLENLRDDDWEQYVSDDGKTFSSLVEKLIGVYTKELKTDNAQSSEDFAQLVDKALERYPKNQNMPYFKAIVLISQGKNQEALTYYKDLILRFPSKFYLWNQITELVDEIDIKIGLLSKALTCGADDEFLGAVRLRLASLLIHKGLNGNSKFELDKYRDTYDKNGWSLKPEFRQMYDQLSTVESAVDNNSIYAEYAVKADEFIYSSLPTVIAVKVAETQSEDRNHPGRKITCWTLRVGMDAVRLKKPTKFRLNKRTPNGTIFDVKLRDGKIVYIKEHNGTISVPWLKEISGEVRLRTDRNGRRFAIISNSYVGEALLKNVNEGQTVKGWAILKEDGRWSALCIS